MVIYAVLTGCADTKIIGELSLHNTGDIYKCGGETEICFCGSGSRDPDDAIILPIWVGVNFDLFAYDWLAVAPNYFYGLVLLKTAYRG